MRRSRATMEMIFALVRETCYTYGVKTMTVREIRQKWPEAEKALEREGEIIVTRDSKPVAKIVRYKPSPRKQRKQFDAEKHMKWLREFWKQQPPQPSTDELLRQDRYDDEQ